MEYSSGAIIRASQAESSEKEKAHIEQVIKILDSCRSAYRKVLLATLGNYLSKFWGTLIWDFVLPVTISALVLFKAKNELFSVAGAIFSKVF